MRSPSSTPLTPTRRRCGHTMLSTMFKPATLFRRAKNYNNHTHNNRPNVPGNYLMVYLFQICTCYMYSCFYFSFYHGQQSVRCLVVQLTLQYVLMCFLNMLLAQQINEWMSEWLTTAEVRIRGSRLTVVCPAISPSTIVVSMLTSRRPRNAGVSPMPSLSSSSLLPTTLNWRIEPYMLIQLGPNVGTIPAHGQSSRSHNPAESKSTRSIQGGPKTGTLCFVRLNFVKYRPIFKLISRSESREHL